MPHSSVLPDLAAELGCTVDDLFDSADDVEAALFSDAPLSREEYALYGALTARIVAAKAAAVEDLRVLASGFSDE